MSRRIEAGSENNIRHEWTGEERLAIEQSLDGQMIAHVKELLISLLKQGRITIEVRIRGEAVLSAAQHAVDHPEERDITLADGARLSASQWWRAQREVDRDF